MGLHFQAKKTQAHSLKEDRGNPKTHAGKTQVMLCLGVHSHDFDVFCFLNSGVLSEWVLTARASGELCSLQNMA